jgi:hypothetical protein
LWYWAKAPSSFDWSMAECFRAFTSCSSKASARSTASPYPWSMPDFWRDLSATCCSRQQMSTGCSESTTDQLLKGIDNSPSSIVRPGASPPSGELQPPGRQGHLPTAQSHHDYSWRLQTLALNGLALHPRSPVNGRLPPELILAVRRRVLLRPSRGLLRWLLPSARGLLRQLLESPAPGLQ